MVRTIPRRWRPVAYSAVGLSFGVLVAGAFLLGSSGSLMHEAGSAEDGSRLRAPLPATPTIVFRSGQNAVRIVERPKPPPEPMPREADATGGRDEAAEISPSIVPEESTTLSTGENGEVGQPAAKDDLPQSDATGREGDGAAGATGNVVDDSQATNDQRPDHATRGAPDDRRPTTDGEQRAEGREPATDASGNRLIRVQVGRFAEERDAHSLSDELKRQGFTPAVVRTERGGQVLYRVQVGTFRQVENADRTMERLRESQLEPYFAEDEERGTEAESRKP